MQLRKERDDLDLSREEVAAALKVSAKTLERWEQTGRIKSLQLGALRAHYAAIRVGRERLTSGQSVPHNDQAPTTQRAARLLIQSRIAALVGDDGEAEKRYMRIVDRAVDEFSGDGKFGPTDLAKLTMSVGQSVISDLEDRIRRGIPL